MVIFCIAYLLLCVQAVGFLVDYLGRVAEVKDTVHKQTLIFHVANIVLDQFPDATDLYSEIGSVTRCAKVDSFLTSFIYRYRLKFISMGVLK